MEIELREEQVQEPFHNGHRRPRRPAIKQEPHGCPDPQPGVRSHLFRTEKERWPTYALMILEYSYKYNERRYQFICKRTHFGSHFTYSCSIFGSSLSVLFHTSPMPHKHTHTPIHTHYRQGHLAACPPTYPDSPPTNMPHRWIPQLQHNVSDLVVPQSFRVQTTVGCCRRG